MAIYLPDHYRLLGLPPNADEGTLKESYRRLSRVFHPDHQQGSRAATIRFQQISGAYAELSDQRRREQYDRMLLLRDPLRFVEDPRAEKALDVLDSVVTRLRKRRRKLPGTERGRDLRVRHPITFRRAALGGAVSVQTAYRTACATCDGQGTLAPDRNPICHVCAGDGRLKVGIRRNAMQCGFCDGQGVVVLAPCERCNGDGMVDTRGDVDVNVPARCPNGALLRVRGAGEKALSGGPPGDLVVEVSIEPDPMLSAAGNDVLCTLPLTWSEAAGGCTVTVPTLEGCERLRIAPGTRSGQEIRIGGRGLPVGGRRGDLRYRVQIDVPEPLTTDQARQISVLEERLGRDKFRRRQAFADAVAAMEKVAADAPDKT